MNVLWLKPNKIYKDQLQHFFHHVVADGYTVCLFISSNKCYQLTALTQYSTMVTNLNIVNLYMLAVIIYCKLLVKMRGCAVLHLANCLVLCTVFIHLFFIIKLECWSVKHNDTLPLRIELASYATNMTMSNILMPWSNTMMWHKEQQQKNKTN